jgi:hypothetical protein
MSLSSLPLELLDECISYLPREQILSLRRLSKAFDLVASRHITEVSVSLTAKSFSNFQQLARHRPLSRSIKVVKIHIVQYDERHARDRNEFLALSVDTIEYDIQRHLVEGRDLSHLGYERYSRIARDWAAVFENMIDGKLTFMCANAAQNALFDAYEDYHQKEREQKDFLESGNIAPRLVASLRSLPSIKQVIAVVNHHPINVQSLLHGMFCSDGSYNAEGIKIYCVMAGLRDELLFWHRAEIRSLYRDEVLSWAQKTAGLSHITPILLKDLYMRDLLTGSSKDFLSQLLGLVHDEYSAPIALNSAAKRPVVGIRI